MTEVLENDGGMTRAPYKIDVATNASKHLQDLLHPSGRSEIGSTTRHFRGIDIGACLEVDTIEG